MPTRLRALLLTLLAVASPATAQQSPAQPRVDRIFAEWDRPDSPGCALGVARDGRLVYERGYGMANLDYDIPNSPEMAYYVGSDSKQFTAAAIGLLALEGRLGLDDDIRKYLPEMRDYGTPITVRHLVHHTSGIRDVYALMSLAGVRMEDVFPDSEAIALIARQKTLNFAPGTAYLYSNSGYFLLAQIVRRVTGQSLREYADARIFRPLGMTRTHFHDDPGHVMKQRAMSYEKDPEGGFRISYLQNFDKIGAGGLYSTIGDLQKWDENFYSHQVGGEALQTLIHTRGVLASGDTLPYAFGNNVTSYRGLRITEHGGSLMGYKAEILRFPDQHFTVLATCNLGAINPGPLAEQVAEVYLGDRMGPARAVAARPRPATEVAAAGAPAPTAEQLSPLAGSYYSEELDATYRVALVDGRLAMSAPRVRAATLVPSGTDTFRAGDLVLRFERGAGGTGRAFVIEAGRVRNMRFERR